MSATRVIGASKETRSRTGSSTRVDLGIVRVLEQRVRERLEHGPVHRDQRGLVLDLHPVAALEVDRPHAAQRRPARARSPPSSRRRVELEADARVPLDAPRDPVHRRRIAEPERVHERHRPRLAPERLGQRQPGLAQREVQRRRLERPVAPVARQSPTPAPAVPLVERRQVVAEALQRPRAGQGQVRPAPRARRGCSAILHDVLADASSPAPASRTAS